MHMLRKRLRLFVWALVPCGALALATPVTASAAAPARSAGLSVPVTGSGTNATFAGTFDIQRFQASGGRLWAVGTLAGTLTNTATGATAAVSQPIQMPVSADQSCQILNLTLGPLDLNLLGLMVHLNQVVLTITAQQGSGNLLGNLLCAVAGLLDNNSSLTAIANLLNQILAAL